MRILATRAAGSGPLGALPVPAPLRDDPMFARELQRHTRAAESESVTAHAPLAIPPVDAENRSSALPVARPDGARAYAQYADPTPVERPGRHLSVRA